MIISFNEGLLTEKERTDLEFKEKFDVSSDQDWCEIIKDIIAITNSGGGLIIFGLRDNGTPSGYDVSSILNLDSAKITDKIHRYTNNEFSDFSIKQCEKSDSILACLIVQGTQIPIVFEKPGTYDIGSGKQQTAFKNGSVYFRHGSKSEPGNSDDLRKAFDRQLALFRDQWLKNVRQVVEAPFGSTVLTISPTDDPTALTVRLSNDPNAPIIGGFNPERTHPYREMELVDLINQQIPPGQQINKYDLRCVRKLFEIEDNLAYHYFPKFSGHHYSAAFSKWIMDNYQADNKFFKKARDEIKEMKRTSKKTTP